MTLEEIRSKNYQDFALINRDGAMELRYCTRCNEPFRSYPKMITLLAKHKKPFIRECCKYRIGKEKAGPSANTNLNECSTNYPVTTQVLESNGYFSVNWKSER